MNHLLLDPWPTPVEVHANEACPARASPPAGESLCTTISKIIRFTVAEAWSPGNKRNHPGMLAAHCKFHKDSIDRILGAHELVKRCTVPPLSVQVD